MVVIVIVVDPHGPKKRQVSPPSRVFYVSQVVIDQSFLTQVEPGETFATVKEEEWVSKKKTEVTNTKQIETRVKRQVVLEDGKVVEDSGPVVTTNTTEDTETQSYHQTELRKHGDDDKDKETAALENGGEEKIAILDKAVAVPNPDGLVREVKERRVISREEIDDVKETEDVQHLGDITDESNTVPIKWAEYS
ncbi:uncharacterized protein LOC116179680 isoform X2 [Photinus pyralis]|uniref:uncharacterized protein LOC116179680 isoform X2 n=1 Tax=Photinus pyralis TaxID=7054 RepID=UPI0012672168|nr:uncharacterized protein LOC116179680 isoform X2 [Photinus pyralis]